MSIDYSGLHAAVKRAIEEGRDDPARAAITAMHEYLKAGGSGWWMECQECGVGRAVDDALKGTN